MAETYHQFYTDYKNKLFNYLRYKSGSSEVAQDIMQESFTRHFKHYGRQAVDSPALLFAIARNTLVDYQRGCATHLIMSSFLRKMNKTIEHIPKTTLDSLLAYDWPGNVREMEHFLERGVILSNDNTLALNDQFFLPSAGRLQDQPIKDLKTLERNHIIHVLNLTDWKINGSDGAANLLDIHPQVRYVFE